MQEMWVWSLEGEDPLEEERAVYSSILANRIPWTEEPGRLQSMGLQSQTWLNDWACTQCKSYNGQEKKMKWHRYKFRSSEEGAKEVNYSTKRRLGRRTSQLVQWLRLRGSKAGGLGSIPGQGTRSHRPKLTVCTSQQKRSWVPQLRLKIPRAATKTWSSHISNK